MSEQSVFERVSGITEDDIEAAERLVGQPLRLEQFNREATIDTIKHFAHGMGDENPLWRDEEYAATGPHGTIAAPPCFLYSVFAPGVSPGFPGLQTFFGSNHWVWHKPILRGDTLRAEAKMTGMQEKTGNTATRMVVQEGETRYLGSNDELVAQNFSKALRIPRAGTGEGLTYKPRETYEYTVEEFEQIEAETLGYKRRGSERRRWEEVEVGDEVGPLVKGPLDLNTIITFYSGALPYGYAPSDVQWHRRHLAKTAPEKIPNNRDAAWVAEMTWPGMGHYQSHVAQAVGMPGVYDNGWMRSSWLSQLITDWAGDHGVVRELEAKLIRPNLMNDTLWVRGEVTGKRVGDDGAQLVDIKIEAKNQIDETTSVGWALVALG